MGAHLTREQLIGRLKRLSADYVEARQSNDVAIMGRLMTDMAETRAQLLLLVGLKDEQTQD